MGMSVGAYLIDTQILKEEVDKLKTRGEIEILDKALTEFGPEIDGKILVLQCDYWEEYSTYFELMRFIELYFGIEDDFEVVNKAVAHEVDHGINANEVAEEIGVELPESEDEE